MHADPPVTSDVVSVHIKASSVAIGNNFVIIFFAG